MSKELTIDQFITQLKSVDGNEALDLIEALQSGNLTISQQQAQPVAYWNKDHIAPVIKMADTHQDYLFNGWVPLYAQHPSPSVPQDLEEKTYFHKSVDGEAIVEVIRVADLRAWMQGHARVPVKATIKIENAIANSRNLKASEIWEDAIAASQEGA